MSFLREFSSNLDITALINLLLRVCAALLCITFHELAHGFVADRLGDHTARMQGRLSLNPVRHIDPFGLLMMIVAGVGWAKPVPVNAGNFKNPKRGMAVTALAGPAANFLMAAAVLAIGSLVYWFTPVRISGALWYVYYYAVVFLARCAMLSVGLGLFNLIPIPPLDGSKIVFSFLPDRAYFTLLRYERYIMLALFVLVFLGVLDGPLQFCIRHVLYLLCRITFFPAAVFGL